MKTLKRRRKENKTDYLKRRKFLQSGIPRLVLRKTNRYLIAQYITSKEAQDSIQFGMTSKKLLNNGWPENLEGSLKSTPAAYLFGLLVGKKIYEEKLKTPIIDLGMVKSIHKNRMYSFVKGLIDSGLKIKAEKDIFPNEERITGKHSKIPFSEIKSKIIGKYGK